MDALIVFGIALFLAKGYERKVEEVRESVTSSVQLVKKRNESFYRDRNAFMSLYNNIMKGAK